MRIERLHIENFRKYDEASFEFHPKFNLIVGENGAGKTSLLEALAVATGSLLLGIRGYDSRHIQKEDVRRVGHFIGSKFTFQDFNPTVVEAWGTVSIYEDVHWKRVLRSRLSGRTTRKEAEELIDIAYDMVELANKGADIVLPLISYYGADRLWKMPWDFDRGIQRKKQAREKEMQSDTEWFGDRFVGYRYSVNNGLNLGELLRWMTYERRVELDEDRKSPYLTSVLIAIKKCLPENISTVRFSIRQETLMFDFSDGRIVPLNDLSDGYRTIVTMVGDIAVKAALLNPHLEERAIDETNGVVLIDELDQHLHPRWQRVVIENLRSAFPEIQFICTTHSPFLIQSLKNCKLIKLDGEIDTDYSNQSIEDIVEDIQGVEMPQKSRYYIDMYQAAEAYYSMLRSDSNNHIEIQKLKSILDDKLVRFADDPILQAYLKVNRLEEQNAPGR